MGEEKRKKIIKTKHGEIRTPFFMPDATRGFMRSLDKNDLEKIGVGPMVVNTYHLYLQLGMETIKKSARLGQGSDGQGGIHNFMNWPYPLLSDSGGYQVFSLIHKNPKMGKITDKEVIFKSPLDGSKHKISPEKAIQIQFDLGVDMMVVLDDPPPNSYSKEKIAAAVERTVAWARRCKDEYEKQIKKRKITDSERPLIFGVIQGGEYLDLRKYCAEELVKIDFDGYGFGGRHIDEKGKFMEEVVRATASFIPEDSLRFALGIGTPEDILKCVSYGWDMFDCVIPTREGRHGRLFIRKSPVILSEIDPALAGEMKSKNLPNNITGNINKQILRLRPDKNQDFAQDDGFYKTININNTQFKDDFSPVDSACDCMLCRNYTRSYLRHMFQMKEPLAMRLASIHNLKFYMDMMKNIRESN